jgi:hypothetical protein
MSEDSRRKRIQTDARRQLTSFPGSSSDLYIDPLLNNRNPLAFPDPSRPVRVEHTPILATTSSTQSRSSDMSKPVLFYGKPNQIEDVLTYVTIRNITDQNTTDQQQCGLLASLFRGQALSWLTQQISDQPKLLNDYDGFVTSVNSAFGLSAEASRAKAARKLSTIHQRGPAQLYAIEFRSIAISLRLDDATARANYTRGLKQHVREAMVSSGPHFTLDDLIKESVRIDTELYHARRQARPAGAAYGQGSRGTIKCHSCGKFGHKSSQCRSKTIKQEF